MSDQPQYPSYPGPEQPQTPPPGYQPPAPYGGGGYPVGPPTPYAGWWSRVGATLLDGIIGLAVAIVPLAIGAALTFKDVQTDPVTGDVTSGVNPGGVAILVLGYVLIFAFQIWNAVFRQGRTGQTLGKKIVGIQVIKADTGQFLGAGTAFLRWLMAAIVGGICFLDYLWPLWDDRKQTWHDKIVGSIVTTK